ncbi:MAG: hypothetical protein U9N87_14325, partial [Planctomycetota bacterium]|nr:hypothetical protein [Planctomycetota bacterium]
MVDRLRCVPKLLDGINDFFDRIYGIRQDIFCFASLRLGAFARGFVEMPRLKESSRGGAKGVVGGHSFTNSPRVDMRRPAIRYTRSLPIALPSMPINYEYTPRIDIPT